jgi:iron complex transport system substrate-binding protein
MYGGNDMKKWKKVLSILFLLPAAALWAGGKKESPVTVRQTVTITDLAGRTVDIPSGIQKVYGSSPVGTNLLYTFDDRLLAGLNFVLTDDEKRFTSAYYQSLPNLGGWFGRGNQGNIEEIIKAAPDLVLSTGTDQASKDAADQLQRQLGIPVVLAKDDLNDLGETYRFLGNILNRKARGEELASYTEQSIQHAKDLTARIPANQRVRVYYAEESDGLHTDPSGSWHSRLIDLCGGINVAEAQITPGFGRTAVSMEQVILWNPEVIIAGTDGGSDANSSYETILTESKWSGIQAVKSGKVYRTPNMPLNWFDRPPSVNTLIGVKWVHAILYPHLADFDLKEETRKFYSLFYHVTLTDADVNEILDKAVPVD